MPPNDETAVIQRTTTSIGVIGGALGSSTDHLLPLFAALNVAIANSLFASMLKTLAIKQIQESKEPSVTSIEERASQYVAQLIGQGQLPVEQPLLLVGYSYGGLVAKEVKRQLNSMGFTKVYVALVDTPTSAETENTIGTFAPQTLKTINQHAKKKIQAPGTIHVSMYTPSEPGNHRQFLLGLYDRIHNDNFHIKKAPPEAVESFKADVEAYLLNLLAALQYTGDVEKIADSTGNEHIFVISSEELATAYGDPNLGWNVPDGNVTPPVIGTTHENLIDATNAGRVAELLVSKVCRSVKMRETRLTIAKLKADLTTIGNNQFATQIEVLQALLDDTTPTELSSPPTSPGSSLASSSDEGEGSGLNSLATLFQGQGGTSDDDAVSAMDDDADDPFVQNSPTDDQPYSGFGFHEMRSRPDAVTSATESQDGPGMSSVA